MSDHAAVSDCRLPVLPDEYSDLRRICNANNYGNDGCDGFSPNFPLIRTGRNQADNIYFL